MDEKQIFSKDEGTDLWRRIDAADEGQKIRWRADFSGHLEPLKPSPLRNSENDGEKENNLSAVYIFYQGRSRFSICFFNHRML